MRSATHVISLKSIETRWAQLSWAGFCYDPPAVCARPCRSQRSSAALRSNRGSQHKAWAGCADNRFAERCWTENGIMDLSWTFWPTSASLHCIRTSSFPFVPLILRKGSALSVNHGNASTLFSKTSARAAMINAVAPPPRLARKICHVRGRALLLFWEWKWIKQEQSLHGQVQQEWCRDPF